MLMLFKWTFFVLVSFVLLFTPLFPLVIVQIICMATQNSRTQKAMDKVNSSLIEGETLVHVAIARRVSALYSRRTVLAVTNSRVLELSRGLLGGFSMRETQIKNVESVELSQSSLPAMSGSVLHVNFDGYDEISLRTFCDIASAMYSTLQREVHAWEERNRVRKLEETRAESGGTFINQAASPAQAGGASGSSILAEIEKAKNMLEEGIINTVEFDEIKSKLLSNPSNKI
ncbi:SHOCT domain-containing protein [Aliagarivorans taiwanensis]|uniref:SHOCT domain-containing protein n=1 Tax=Aliagarivorans taiwanensis TaxID=561966 RepID=UPI0004791439|nr:SHOCT domain-containing protein [Aliagarivorans taiwanensis]